MGTKKSSVEKNEKLIDVDFAQLPKDDVILEMDARTSLYNTLPPGMQYRVLSVNNIDDGNSSNIAEV